ncbi:YjgN family protein [Marinobacterium jannaschii]|uniref:YjgN family protein n=1 Tax=Marinobacterium jannaschii TaxID=64970 RepID=UPI000485B296|nr:YjgN family protein [Marinobacterium jannaschii]
METSESSQTLEFKFSGSTGEFFKIWIVNICLSIVTLGIYSAWAKVRTNQYFYGHTALDGSSFEYTAKPLQILQGRILAFIVFASYSLLGQFFPIAAVIMALLILPFIPWIILRALQFNARNTRYRNIRFGYEGSYWTVALNFILLPLLGALSFGLAWPWVQSRQQRFLVDNARFGSSAFSSNLSTGAFYKIYLVVFGLGIIAALLMFAIMSFMPVLGAFSGLLVLPLYYLAYVFIKVQVINMTLNNSELEGHRFSSTLRTGAFFKLMFINSCAILLTLGLAIPWAKIRMARYRAESTAVIAQGSLDNFIRNNQQDDAAFGEELSDMMDIELGF